MIGWALKQFAIWGGLGLLLYAVLGDRLAHHPAAPGIAAPSAAPASSQEPSHDSSHVGGAMPNSLEYRANSQGHVVIDGVVNGAPVRFLVDTGATMVVLTMQDAAAAGLSGSDLKFTMQTSTANGVARAAPVTLREVRLGQLSVDDVPAAVSEKLGISLLGQSFLTRLDSYQMHDGVLTLNYW
jgi:aspartyl protease family protein